MWHLKTKIGTFWVIRTHQQQYFLGVNDEELGIYRDVDQAARDVYEHVTGCLKWDTATQVNAPEHITEWIAGVPQEWGR